MRYAAFFRGLNLGRTNRLKMAALRQMFSDCGFKNVSSYIQSGNVIFDTKDDPKQISTTIESSFADTFGFASPVILRSAEDLSALLNDLPFSEDDIKAAEAKNPEVQHLYFYLANSEIDPDIIQPLVETYAGEDRLWVGQKDLVLLCAGSVRHSKLASALNRLDPPLTARNLKTLTKVHDLILA